VRFFLAQQERGSERDKNYEATLHSSVSWSNTMKDFMKLVFMSAVATFLSLTGEKMTQEYRKTFFEK
jgi:hypothetical protein